MAVTSMQRTTKIAILIKKDFPAISFKLGEDFYWSSESKTIVHKPINKVSDLWQLLHEVAHAKLGHKDYQSDIDLIKYEALAWNYAANELAPRYDLNLDSNFVEDSLDTYRNWLHKRSLCPNCMQTGIQQNENTYSCLNCRCSWRVNEARLCGLRRKTLGNSLATAAN